MHGADNAPAGRPRLILPWARRTSPPSPSLVVELVTPRTNAASVSAVERALGGLAPVEPFALDLATGQGAPRFCVRTATHADQEAALRRLGAAYPQATAYPLDAGSDPARLDDGEQAAIGVLVLRASPCLPLRTFSDLELDPIRAAQGDPVLGVLAALSDTPAGWRSVSQLVLRPAPADWGRPYLELALEPLGGRRASPEASASSTQGVGLATLFGLGALGLAAFSRYQAHDWLHLGAIAGGSVSSVGVWAWLAPRLGRRTVLDPRLVREKLCGPAFVAELRLALIAPRDVPGAAVRADLARLAAAYRPFDLPAGNGFRLWLARSRWRDPRRLAPLGRRTRAILTAREVAALWHLPHAAADVPRLARTAARHAGPAPSGPSGCRIGMSVSAHDATPVYLPDDLLRRHLLLVAKTRRGKSSLMLRLAQHLMEPGRGAAPAALVLVDPHRDLAEATLGLVPKGRWDDVVALDVAEPHRPFGLNLLDVGLGWDRDKAVSNALAIFRREFSHFWGPRMEDAFRFALLTLFVANEALCAGDPDGRDRQHTMFDVAPLLMDAAFRRQLLAPLDDPVVLAWWSDYFEPLDRRLQHDIVNPVLTKLSHVAGARWARRIAGQPRSTIDPAAWVRDGKIVVVSTAKGVVGEETAALVGGTLLNLVALVVGEQARLAPGDRRRCAILVDELHTMPGAAYEEMLAELGKYGASLVLATQSIARLEALGKEDGRALRAALFANLDGLIVFHCSAEDARYLAPELGGQLDELDLLELGDYACYGKLTSGGRRLPVCSVQLDPPPASDPGAAARLAAVSAARYGRPVAAVDADLLRARARVERARQTIVDLTRGASDGSQDKVAGKGKGRKDEATERAAQPRLDDPSGEAGGDRRQVAGS